MGREMITTRCYNQERVWESREAAKAFYMDAMLNSEGSERGRYARIYEQLECGETYCSDMRGLFDE